MAYFTKVDYPRFCKFEKTKIDLGVLQMQKIIHILYNTDTTNILVRRELLCFFLPIYVFPIYIFLQLQPHLYVNFLSLLFFLSYLFT